MMVSKLLMNGFSHAGAVKVAAFDGKVYQAKEEFLSRLENGDGTGGIGLKLRSTPSLWKSMVWQVLLARLMVLY